MSDQTIDRTELPIRRPPFRGVVKRTLDGSQPDWNYVAPLTPPEGAPNILLIRRRGGLRADNRRTQPVRSRRRPYG